jgi:hypothetical protein
MCELTPDCSLDPEMLRIEAKSLLEEKQIIDEQMGENPYALQSWRDRYMVWSLKVRLAEIMQEQDNG